MRYYKKSYFRTVGNIAIVFGIIGLIIFDIGSIVEIIGYFKARAEFSLILLSIIETLFISIIFLYLGLAFGRLCISHSDLISHCENLEEKINNLKKDNEIRDGLRLPQSETKTEMINLLKKIVTGNRVKIISEVTKFSNGKYFFLEKGFEGIVTYATETTSFVRFDKYKEIELEIEDDLLYPIL